MTSPSQPHMTTNQENAMTASAEFINARGEIEHVREPRELELLAALIRGRLRKLGAK